MVAWKVVVVHGLRGLVARIRPSIDEDVSRGSLSSVSVTEPQFDPRRASRYNESSSSVIGVYSRASLPPTPFDAGVGVLLWRPKTLRRRGLPKRGRY